MEVSSDPFALARESKAHIRTHVELKGLFSQPEEAAGFAWENMNGASIDGCLPGNFPVIDDVWDDGQGCYVATSYKTMNTFACYDGLSSEEGKRAFFSKVAEYVNELADFGKYKRNLIQRNGGGLKEVEVSADKMSAFCLEIAVPLEDIEDNKQYIKNLEAELISQNLRHKRTQRPISVSFRFIKDIWLPSPGYLLEIAADSQIKGQPSGNFKAIDSFHQSSHGNRSTSLKVVDLRRHYQGGDGPARLLTTLRGYLTALTDFRSTGYKERGKDGRQIKPDEVGVASLCIAIPENYDREMFGEALLHFYKEAHENGVEVEIMLAPD
jgi:hypothetical protein